MKRVLRWFSWLLLVAIVWGLLSHPGTIRLNWLGYDVEMAVATALFAFLVLVQLLFFINHFLRWVVGVPKRWRADRMHGKAHKAAHALVAAFDALAAGDARTASKEAEAALRHYKADASPLQPLAHLLKARAYQQLGQKDAAEAEYRNIASHPESAFLGRRGLMNLASQRWQDAPSDALLADMLSHAEQALQLRADAIWPRKVQLYALFRLKRMEGISSALRAAAKHDVITPSQADAMRSAQLILEAEQDASPEAKLKKAIKLCPSHAEASNRLMQHYLDSHEWRPAGHLIQQAWQRCPHAPMAEAFATAVTEQLWQKTLIKLIKLQPEHSETLAIQAWDCLRTGKDAEAEKILQRLRKSSPASSTYRGWACSHCGSFHQSWQAVCDHCQEAASIIWHSCRHQPQNLAVLPEAISIRLASLDEE